MYVGNFRVFIHEAQRKSVRNSHCKEPLKNGPEFLKLEAYPEISALDDIL